jgi:hypothetical protein
MRNPVVKGFQEIFDVLCVFEFSVPVVKGFQVKIFDVLCVTPHERLQVKIIDVLCKAFRSRSLTCCDTLGIKTALVVPSFDVLCTIRRYFPFTGL